MSTIVSIHSFRGGTGKSNITANIAAQTALAGHRVGIIDTDINSPGIHVLFGLNEQNMGHTLNEFLHGQCTIEEAAYDVGAHAASDPAAGRQKLAGTSLYLVPSSINGEEITQVLRDGYDVSKLNEGINALRKNLKLDYLFIDTHPGLNEETLLSIALSDILVIIMRPDQQDFQGTAVTVDVARGLDVPHLFLVVNKALTKYDFNQVRQKVEGEYQAAVAAVFPLSEDIADLASADLFSLCDPRHAWSQAARQVAQTVMEAG